MSDLLNKGDIAELCAALGITGAAEKLLGLTVTALQEVATDRDATGAARSAAAGRLADILQLRAPLDRVADGARKNHRFDTRSSADDLTPAQQREAAAEIRRQIAEIGARLDAAGAGARGQREDMDARQRQPEPVAADVDLAAAVRDVPKRRGRPPKNRPAPARKGLDRPAR